MIDVIFPPDAELIVGDVILIAHLDDPAELPGLDPAYHCGPLFAENPGDFADSEVFLHNLFDAIDAGESIKANRQTKVKHEKLGPYTRYISIALTGTTTVIIPVLSSNWMREAAKKNTGK